MGKIDGAGIHRITSSQKVQVRNDDKTFTQLCKSLGDDISFAIVKSTINQSRPAVEIAKAHHVPLSSVYKKIRKLKDLGIIDVDKIDVDSRSGKRIAFYRSRVESVELSLTGSDTRVRIETHLPRTESSEIGKSNSL